ncbi:MAG: tyrosine-type recombinase/integrase [Hyphomicrobiaceae bacterium]
MVDKAKLGGRYIGHHALRHAAATWLADADVPMHVIQRYLGHDQLESTETIYAKATAAKRTDASDALEIRMKRAIEGGEVNDPRFNEPSAPTFEPENCRVIQDVGWWALQGSNL